MATRTPLVDRRIVSLVVEGIPSDLPESAIKRHVKNAGNLHETLRAVLNADLTRVNVRHLQALLEGQPIGPETYKDEEVESSYGYPEGFAPKSPAEKLTVLERYFPGLDSSHVQQLALACMDNWPFGAEELLVCPKPSKVADNYNDALIKVLGLLGASRTFGNWREGELGPDFMRLTDQTAEVLAKLETEMPGDYLVIPVQMGLRHRGRSVRRARVCFTEKEFGLGPFEVACYLLSCPERVSRWEDLTIDCVGVDYQSEPDDEWGHCLYFCFGTDGLLFDDCWTDGANEYYGSASGFLW